MNAGPAQPGPVCIIPARGGSKRIPKKNVRPFRGKPIIAWSIDAARAARSIERVIVSTDDDEIARTAKHRGAEVPFRRPAPLADDHAGADAVILHALGWLYDQGEAPSHACCLYPTAPFVTPDLIDAGFQALHDTGAATAIAVTPFSFPIWRALRIEGDRARPIWPENRLRRSQDLEPAYQDAGQCYWLAVERYQHDPRIMGDDAAPVLVPPHRVQDIDTEEDWIRAEAMHVALEARP